MRIREVLRTKGQDVHTVQASEQLAEVLSRFTDSKIRCLVVTEDMSLKGMLTLRDVVAFIDERGASALDGTVAEAMTSEVISVTPDSSIDEAEAIFTAKRFNHLPVVEDGIVAGLVTPPDVLEVHLKDVQVANALLKDYCTGVYY